MDAVRSFINNTSISMSSEGTLPWYLVYSKPCLTLPRKHSKSHGRQHQCWYPSCTFGAYQQKDVKRHINTVHGNVKIPCPVVACPYSRNGPRRGISRKDALKRHLLNHGMTLDNIAYLQSLESCPTDHSAQSDAPSSPQDSSDSDSFLDFLSFPVGEL